MRVRARDNTLRLAFLMIFGLLWGMLLPGLLLLPIFGGKPLIANVRLADSPFRETRAIPANHIVKKESTLPPKAKAQKKELLNSKLQKK